MNRRWTVSANIPRAGVTAFALCVLAACGGGGSGGGGGGGGGTGGGGSYTVGGTISGLTGSGLQLQDNGGDTLSVNAGATSFTFATALASAAGYAVTISAQPSGQSCTLANSSGAIASANITNVSITCTATAAATYTVGGTIGGLTGSGLQLQDNGGDTLSVNAGATSFTFATALASGADYAVTISAQPSGQSCTLANGSGAIASANITNVSITCTNTASAATETVLHTFAGKAGAGGFTAGDGDSPGPLIQASDGNFYGLTIYGGVNNAGTLFKITAAGVATVLYSFGASSTDAGEPNALIQGTDGNFYGTTAAGGRYNAGDGGTVFKMTPAGVETILHSFPSNSTDGYVPVGLIQAADGDFYGITNNGGAHPNSGNGGTLFKLTSTGTQTILYSFGASSTDGFDPNTLIQGADGNFYGTTQYGGANYNPGSTGSGTFFKITPAGVETVLYSFGASSTEGFWPTSLILGKDGNFYGTTSHGGASGGGTVFRITLAGVETVLYAFGTSSTDGNNPNTLIQAADANLYGTTLQGGANISDGTVFKVTLAGAETITYSFGISNADGYYPVSVIQGSDGNFYDTAGGGSLGHGVVFKLSN